MTLIEIEKEITSILDRYEHAENKQELDKRLKYLRGILNPREPQEIKPKPKQKRKRKTKRKPKRSAHTKRYKYYLKIAKENGITRNQYYRRTTRLGWDYKDAATVPLRHYTK